VSRPDPRYQISVRAEQWKDYGGGVRPERIDARRENWKARTHQRIIVTSTFDLTKPHRYSREEVVAAHRWAAGVIARTMMTFLGEGVGWHGDFGVGGCPLVGEYDWPIDEMPCGDLLGYVGFPLEAAQLHWNPDFHAYTPGPPKVTVSVPRERVTEMVNEVRRILAKVLLDDAAPVAGSRPEHTGHHTGTVGFTETTTSQEAQR
jgi:hypothetical protein